MFRLKKKMFRDTNRQPVARMASHDYAAAYPQDYFFQNDSNEEDQQIEVEAYNRRWCVKAVLACVVACSINVAVGCSIGFYLGPNATHRLAVPLPGKTESLSSGNITGSSGGFGGLSKIRAFTLSDEDLAAGPRSNAAATVKGWNAKNRKTENIALRNDSFVIQGNVTGPIVQIYSHLCFKPTVNGTFMFRQAIKKPTSEPDKPESLLVDSQLTNCVTSGRIDYPPCYCSVLFSTLLLRKDDRIFVEIDHYAYLDRRPESSFFGIYILG